MARFPFPSRISTRIGLIIVLMAGAFAVVMGTVLTRSMDEVLAEQEARNLASAAVTQQQVLAGILDEVARDLRFLAGLHRLRDARSQASAPRGKREDLPLASGIDEGPLWQLLRTKSDYLSARLVTQVPEGLAAGGVERTTAGLAGIPPGRTEARQWPPGWQLTPQARQDDKVFFSWPPTAPPGSRTGRPRVVLTGWIAVPGAAPGTAALAIDLDLEAALSRVSAALPSEWTYAVADEKGNIVFNAHRPVAAGESHALSQLEPNRRGLAEPGGRGVIETLPADGGSGGKFLSVQRVPLEGGARPRALTLLLSVEARAVDPAVRATRLQVLLLSLAFIVVLAFVTVLAARRFLLPLRQIVGAIRRFAVSDAQPPALPTGAQDELGVVARAFQGMMREVLAKTEALRDSELRYRLILGAAGDGILGFDADTNITFVNPAASAMLGYPPEALLGASLHRVHPEPSRGREPICPLCAKARDGSVAQGIQLFRHADGHGINVEFVSTPLRNGARLAGGVLVFKDVTQREQLQRMKEEFVSTVSHELRTPMTSVLGSLQLVLRGTAGEVPAEVRELLEIAQGNGERLVRIISDILDVDKLESGKMELTLAAVPLAGVVTRAMEAMQPLAEQSGVRLQADSPLPDCVIQADRERLLQVATNLISNAVKFSPRGGTVRLALQRGGTTARVSVADEGPGVPLEFHSRIFQKFAQADSSDRRARGGTGLGLSICKAIVEQHGGHIGFETTPGHGAKFYFDLPLSQNPESGSVAVADGVPAGP